MTRGALLKLDRERYVTLSRGENGYHAECKSLGVSASGKTEKQCLDNLRRKARGVA